MHCLTFIFVIGLTGGLLAASTPIDSLLSTLENSSLPFEPRIDAAKKLVDQYADDPRTTAVLCRHIKLRSPNVPRFGSGAVVDSTAIFPVGDLIAKMGVRTFPILLDAYASETDSRARSLLGAPIALIMQNQADSKALWLAYLGAEVDKEKRERLIAFGRDVLLLEDPTKLKVQTPEVREIPPPASTPSTITTLDPQNEIGAQPLSKASEAKPVAAIEAPSTPTPWSMTAVVIVAVIGLLWLLLKKWK